jgi:hypothetical protein
VEYNSIFIMFHIEHFFKDSFILLFRKSILNNAKFVGYFETKE